MLISFQFAKMEPNALRSHEHWQIQGVLLAYAPQQDPILSFSHTFLPKSTHIGGWYPPMAWCPPTGNPESTTNEDNYFWIFQSFKNMISLKFIFVELFIFMNNIRFKCVSLFIIMFFIMWTISDGHTSVAPLMPILLNKSEANKAKLFNFTKPRLELLKIIY